MIAATQYYYQLCGSAVERLTAEKNIEKERNIWHFFYLLYRHIMYFNNKSMQVRK